MLNSVSYINTKLALLTYLDENTTVATKDFTVSVHAFEPPTSIPSRIVSNTISGDYHVVVPPEIFGDTNKEVKIEASLLKLFCRYLKYSVAL